MPVIDERSPWTVARADGFEIPASIYLAAMEEMGIRRALAAPPPTSAYGVEVTLDAIAATAGASCGT